jgi:hypothetical protein
MEIVLPNGDTDRKTGMDDMDTRFVSSPAKSSWKRTARPTRQYDLNHAAWKK